MAEDWYQYYHMQNLNHATPKPKGRGVYIMPNSTNEYPPDYGPYHVVTSSASKPPTEIYSGIEPLSALRTNEMRSHFQGTSLPETAELIGKRSWQHKRPLVKKPHDILQQMDAAVEFY